ncbi:DUF624 domain-containing protein [Neobacillus sp. PS3-34]|uniref:YesL family protein n=1 Tax=Neobacillus sp. PS3-34 TaxID=3070678 RepID=UPI0027E13087|nr:DUF624 domain-containing protein [Neobacillus sp. PS3-34]WML48348.1 DUF624 domain-containing protein [Neobacillus sp. PS3-34]
MENTFTNKKWHILMNSFFEFIYLNLLWILFSLPIFTMSQATAAMFGVIRKWLQGEDIVIFSSFKKLFIDNFSISLITGLIWLLLGFILLMDFYFINRFSFAYQMAGLFLFGISSFLFSMVSVYLFPVIVHLKTGWAGVWRNALILAISNPIDSMINIGIAFAVLFLGSRYPILLFGLGSIGAYYQYQSVNRIFLKLKEI